MARIMDRPVLSERVRKLRETLLQTTPRLSCERLRILTDVYKETEGQPSVLRRAKLLDRFLRSKTIFIDGNPVVGTQTEHLLGGLPYPELSCDWMVKEVEAFTLLGKLESTEEDKLLLAEAAEYWQDKCIKLRRDEIWAQKYPGIDPHEMFDLGVWRDNTVVPAGRFNVDYGKVLREGLRSIIAQAQEHLESLPVDSREALHKRDFYNAVIIAHNAVIAMAHRYADLAAGMANKEPNPDRKQELERISQTCCWIPENPARTFYEAVQSFWFVHLTLQIDHTTNGLTPGRFPLYMYPFYEKDEQEGRITPEEAIELFEFLFLKFTAITRYTDLRSFKSTQGSQFQNISLGGVNEYGEDATNELDFLILEAQKRVRLTQPTLSILYHDKLSQEFLLKAAEVVRTGIGMPAFFNNDLNIQRLINQGASLEDARNHAIIGCVEAGFSHNCKPLQGLPFNIAKFLELALNNGKDPVSGRQIGPKSGDAEKFVSYDELHEAIKKQLEYIVSLGIEDSNLLNYLDAEYQPYPFTSALIDDCLKNGVDMKSGGARYHMDGSGTVGVIDLTDSLAAIKKLVFEEKKFTIKELLEALQTDFHGKDEIRHMLLEAPKYGNDDDYVDRIAREWYDIFFKEHQKHCDHLGKPIRPWALSITFHPPFGAKTGALPSGRKSGLPLADGSVSAEAGMDKNGPTALIRSAAKVVDCSRYAANLLNMKFHPSMLENIEGLRKLLALIKTYIDLGGHHIQFNVVSTTTLKDAQAYPENYRDLIVRVAGFSAFFIHLDQQTQDEIISRSELRFGA